MTDIKSLTIEQLVQFCEKQGWEEYRAYQIFVWLYQKNAAKFDEMTNLSKRLREELNRHFYISNLLPVRTLSSTDSAVKLTLALEDNNAIESVLLFDRNRRTICVSSQVGCPLNCRICATARLGFKRNLKWYEIVEQVQALTREKGVVPTNIVFMGMGEPLLNLNEVIEAIKVMNSNYGLKIGARRITVSTAGIPDGIYRLAESSIQVRLAVSLNASNDPIRSMLMPINHRYPIKMLLEAVHKYYAITHRRVTFEYVLVDGVNNFQEDGLRLVQLLKDIPCKINLIPFNPFPGSTFRPPSPAAVKKFAQSLYPHLPAVTIRKSKGSKILAGCGQLAGLSNLSGIT
ncbi:MAG: 23S rRNA (adenine(2503)-C(2))-methyltransferase RlmN [bacterium]